MNAEFEQAWIRARGEGWPGPVAAEALEAGSVVGLDTNGRVDVEEARLGAETRERLPALLSPRSEGLSPRPEHGQVVLVPPPRANELLDRGVLEARHRGQRPVRPRRPSRRAPPS